ncbi:MAG TPA: alpha/beta hydrolase [Microbacteriaceae bacterium]|nr:alpha/beta hydrolase [Microbacteriaceae bacterium]
MPSPASRAYRAAVKRAGGRSSMLKARHAQAVVDAVRSAPERVDVPTGVLRHVRVERREWVSVRHVRWPLYDIIPGTVQPENDRVLYLHGGAYVGQIGHEAWWFAARLALQSRRVVTVAIYPLVPFVTAADLVAQSVEVVRAERERGSSLSVVGDSAGGGLALATSMALRDASDPAIESLVLVSPWSDVSVSHPDVAARARRDVMLAPAGLRHFGELYRGELAPDDWRASPAHGNFTDLPRMFVCAAEDDILYSDAITVHRAAQAAGVASQLLIGERMLHVWPLAHIPEGIAALGRIVSFIDRETAPN